MRGEGYYLHQNLDHKDESQPGWHHGQRARVTLLLFPLKFRETEQPVFYCRVLSLALHRMGLVIYERFWNGVRQAAASPTDHTLWMMVAAFGKVIFHFKYAACGCRVVWHFFMCLTWQGRTKIIFSRFVCVGLMRKMCKTTKISFLLAKTKNSNN